MAETELGINLTLIDNATAQIKQSMGEIQGQTKKVEEASNQAGKSIKDQFKDAGRELKDFRRTMFIVTAAFAAIIGVTREAAKFNQEAADSYFEFTSAVQSLSVMLGQTLAPALAAVGNVIGMLQNTIESAIAGLIKLSSFLGAFFASLSQGPVQAYKSAMEIAEQQTDEFLNKIEETRANVAKGWDLKTIQQNAVDLGKLAIKTRDVMIEAWSASADALGQLGAALEGASAMGRSFAVAAAAIAIGQAVINTAVGVTKALAEYPWPFSMAIAGMIAAAGAIQIATIAATKFHEGGMIRAHDGLTVDEVPIIAQTGEGILSRRGMSALGGSGVLNRLNSGQGGSSSVINIEINNPIVNSMENIDMLTEEISRRLNNEIERL